MFQPVPGSFKNCENGQRIKHFFISLNLTFTQLLKLGRPYILRYSKNRSTFKSQRLKVNKSINGVFRSQFIVHPQ